MNSLRRKQLALCVSGGLDSYIAYHYAIREFRFDPDNIAAIFFDIGQPYAEKERSALLDTEIPFLEFKLNLIRPELHNVPTQDQYVIPGRNLIFASIAAGFGEIVWIVGMKYEDHPLMHDKNTAFYDKTTSALCQAIGGYTVVESPFISKTKTDIIQWGRTQALPYMHRTTSCYHSTLLRCGECSLCFKRYVAMMACGIAEEYATDPRTSHEAKRLIEAYQKAWIEQDFSHYQEDRIRETFKVLGIEVP